MICEAGGGMFPMANRLVIVGIIVRIIKLKSAFMELSPPQTNMTGKAPDHHYHFPVCTNTGLNLIC